MGSYRSLVYKRLIMVLQWVYKDSELACTLEPGQMSGTYSGHEHVDQ